MNQQAGEWNRSIRRIHLVLAVAVSIQLVLGMVMSRDTPLLIKTHFFFGLFVALVVLTHWVISLRSGPQGMAHLFPWSGAGLRAVTADFKGALRGRLAPGGPGGKLAGFIHGLGLLAATGMAATGVTIFYFIQTGQAKTPPAHDVREIHQAIALLLEIYWVGHVGIGIIHKLKGHDTIRQMMRLD
jgi:cytochrome b561